MTTTLALFGNIGTTEFIAIMVIALLLFGRRLPEVGRSLGTGIVEFKKGLRDIQEEVETQVNQPTPQQPAYRAPITDGQDQRVARGQTLEAQTPSPAPQAPANPQA